MSDANTGAVISLPQALQSIGENFSPDLFTRTGHFSIRLALLSGRGGHQPSLTLVSSSGNPSGASEWGRR